MANSVLLLCLLYLMTCIGDTENACPAVQFQCDNNKCIRDSWNCDGDDDCGDGSDEKNCVITCKTGLFQCDNTKCIPDRWRCDEDIDCYDGSDEKNCGNFTCVCKMDEFQCDNRCINGTFRCDGADDCVDGFDEKNCSNTARVCTAGQFQCDDNHCIADKWKCDRDDDCKDGSDEKNCDKTCATKNGGCNQKCVDIKPGIHRCECHKGFKFAPNSTTDCQDIDECKLVGWCSQLCTNNEGGYKCHCIEGYSLVDDKNCRTDRNIPEFLLASSRDIRKISVNNGTNSELLIEIIKGEYVASFDLDVRGNRVYWIEGKPGQILSAAFNDNSNVVAIAENMTRNGIAVDWIHQHLYWTSDDLKIIAVSSLDGQMTRGLVTQGLDRPNDIVVEPNSGFLYWTDLGEKPKIEKCGMDGSMREIIVQTGIIWPNGITIDYIGQRLYWVDGELGSIDSVDFYGRDRRTVHKSKLPFNHQRHPCGITVFEDSLYWTDSRTRSVRTMSKFGVGEPVDVYYDTVIPLDVKMLHESRQPIFENKCGTDNGGCSHFCLPSPVSNNGRHYSCVCQNKFKVASDGTTCIESESVLTPTKPNITTERSLLTSVKPSTTTKSFEKQVLLKLQAIIGEQKEGVSLLRQLVDIQGARKEKVQTTPRL